MSNDGIDLSQYSNMIEAARSGEFDLLQKEWETLPEQIQKTILKIVKKDIQNPRAKKFYFSNLLDHLSETHLVNILAKIETIIKQKQLPSPEGQ